MAKQIFAANKTTGGTSGCLDDIIEAAIENGNLAIVIHSVTNKATFYKYSDSSAEAESDPEVIIPDDNVSGTGAWLLVGFDGTDVKVRDDLTVDENAYITGDVDVTGSVQIDTDLNVDGTITLVDIALSLGATIDEFSIDGTLAGNSDSAVPTEKAVKTYVDGALGGITSNAITQLNSNVTVTDAGVGSITMTPDAVTEVTVDANGMALKSGASVNEFSTDGTLAGDSDDAVPTEKAVKTYADTKEPANANIQSHISSTANPHSVDETDILPSQAGNADKVLGTNGTITAWVDQASGGTSESDVYQDVLDGSKYQHMTFDIFADETLTDAVETDADFNETETRYDFTVGEIIESDDLYDSDAALSAITECMVEAIYTDSGTPTIEATADGTNWETVTLNTVHTFTDTGTTLQLRFTAGGTGHLDSWAVFYNPDTQAIVEPVDWLSWQGHDPLGFARANLLINPQFTINQRGYAGGALGAWAYGYDRWCGGGGGVTMSLSGDVATISAGNVVQKVESGVMVEGETYTISNEGTAILYDYAEGAFVDSMPYTFVYTAADWGSDCLISFGTGTLKQPMLVAGPYVAPFQARKVADELALCQRYYQTIKAAAWIPLGVFRGSGGGSRMYGHRMDYLVSMRTSPTATQTSSIVVNYYGQNGGGTVVGAAGALTANCQASYYYFDETVTCTNGVLYTGTTAGALTITLDAEL